MGRTERLAGIHYRTGQPIAVDIENGLITGIHPCELPGNGLPRIAPGFVDLQVNGYSGLDFNAVPIAEGTVRTITERLWRYGVTTYLPTVITNSPEAIGQAVAAIGHACDRDAVVRTGIAHIHLEGPFISPEDGPRGAHKREYVRGPDWELFSRWQDASGGRIGLVTLSPEWPEAPAFIRRCTDSGVTVSIGHTAASSDQIARAVEAGASLSTHLGNAAHAVLPRHPNYIWDQLADDRLHACLIADGVHLPDAFLRTALRVKGTRAMLVSDLNVLGGMPPGEYELQVGRKVVVTAEGRLHLSGRPGVLAGSGAMLLQGVEHLTRKGISSLADAWDMASVRPAVFRGLPACRGLAIGAPADLVLFREEADGRLRIAATYKQGVKRWEERDN